jgi:hypothetical protein
MDKAGAVEIQNRMGKLAGEVNPLIKRKVD